MFTLPSHTCPKAHSVCDMIPKSLWRRCHPVQLARKPGSIRNTVHPRAPEAKGKNGRTFHWSISLGPRAKPASLAGLLSSAPLDLFQPSPATDTPSSWLVLGVFVGLPIVLWTYKCLMMYIFQRKIIYMGYLPPDARTQKLTDVDIHKNVSGEEVAIQSERKVTLSGIIVRRADASNEPPRSVILYLQGNAGNPLGRIPVFESLLLSPSPSTPKSPLHSTRILAVAPRSYWTSAFRTPTQPGILSDYRAALDRALSQFPDSEVILYGHSLGGSIAVCLLAELETNRGAYDRVRGLILENPFSSIPNMVRALYPQTWLPYHHMGGLVWDKWDAESGMRRPPPASVLDRVRKDTMVIVSEKDELVPREMGESLFKLSRDSIDGMKSETAPGGERGVGRMSVIEGALHEDAWMKKEWAKEIERYIKDIQGRQKNQQDRY